ncbi:ACT domain-containing protein ACR1-like isoform X2 [Tasmannia lanceolata]
MECHYQPYFDPEYESLIERIYPPRVCIDNDTREDCTLVKVDSKNKHGILLEMVQVLTDLDLVISKSYISSDGRWLMDVFHVTDQLGNKITDEPLINYIQQSLCAGSTNEEVGPPRHVPAENTTVEMTATDRPGLLSEISAVLAGLDCHIMAAKAWTHNKRAALIMYVVDQRTGGPISDRDLLSHMEEQLQNMVGKKRVRISGPTKGQTHTERRLHQMMFADRDYEMDGQDEEGRRKSGALTVEICNEKGYSVVSVKSRDRPKLLFDTVCALTDMDYVVFHAVISSHGSLAVQEYYLRHRNGCTLDTESERRRLTQCLVAAVERRVSYGLRLDVCTCNKLGLLSDIMRVFGENGLSVARAEIATRGERAVGAFYVTDTSGNDVEPATVESLRKEIGAATVLEVNNSHPWTPLKSKGGGENAAVEEQPRFSLGSLLWSQLERLSRNFGSIRS